MGDKDWMVQTFVQSCPNPAWEVTVTHLPTGRIARAAGKGNGSRSAARELRTDLEASLGIESPHPDGWSNRA